MNSGPGIAKLEVDGVELTPAEAFVDSFTGVEEVSQLFRWEINILSEDPALDFSKFINKLASLKIESPDEEVTLVCGLIVDIQQGAQISRRYVYHLVLVPRLWLLSLNYQNQVFQELSVQDIIKKVLQQADATSDYRVDTISTEPREYCVQYQETDLDFISRLMEQEGIYYFFKHDEKDLLVITEESSAAPEIPLAGTMDFNEGGGLVPGFYSVQELVCRERLVTGKVILADYDYSPQPDFLQGTSQINNKMPGFRYEHESGQLYRNGRTGSKLAEIRNQELECQRRVMHGESDSPGMRCGHKFTLERHYRNDLNASYFITQVRHHGDSKIASAGRADSGPGAGLVYRNEFTCIPLNVPYRPPRRTPVPRIPGVMSAKIINEGSNQADYAPLDPDGQYKAAMIRDREGNLHESPWIRMSQPYSGPEYGIHFPNHVGSEMLWACINGNPDRPLALGTIPNPNNKSPSVADNRMQSVIRTQAGNEILLDDTADKTIVQVKTKDANSVLLDDAEDRILVTTKDKHTFTLDDKNENIEVKTKNGHVVVLDDKNEKIAVTSKDGHTFAINDKDELIVIKDKAGLHQFTIDIQNKKLIIKTENGNIDLHAPKGTLDIQAKAIKMKSEADTEMEGMNIKMKATANLEAEATGNYKQKGTNVTSEATASHTVKGAMVKSEGSAKNDVAGAMVGVKASGVAIIQGSLVKIN